MKIFSMSFFIAGLYFLLYQNLNFMGIHPIIIWTLCSIVELLINEWADCYINYYNIEDLSQLA